MIEPVSITLIITSIATLIVSLYGHITKSSCCGVSVETEPINK